tara:strand:- start:92 stop:259 length:168 start_codon:yes stop_codon:yes gene_type:complete
MVPTQPVSGMMSRLIITNSIHTLPRFLHGFSGLAFNERPRHEEGADRERDTSGNN